MMKSPPERNGLPPLQQELHFSQCHFYSEKNKVPLTTRNLSEYIEWAGDPSYPYYKWKTTLFLFIYIELPCVCKIGAGDTQEIAGKCDFMYTKMVRIYLIQRTIYRLTYYSCSVSSKEIKH